MNFNVLCDEESVHRMIDRLKRVLCAAKGKNLVSIGVRTRLTSLAMEILMICRESDTIVEG